MSMRSVRSGRASRPAPPGTHRFTKRSDRMPHGWAPLDPTRIERVRVHADSALLNMADAAARSVSRRTFLKRAGQMAFAVGVSMSWIVKAASPAAARCYQCGDPCGPSPPCGSSKCVSGTGDCKTSVAGVRYRDHDDFFCTNSSGQCWTANCCAGVCPPGQQQSRLCCDCCIDADPNTCTSPCDPKKACICSKVLGC